MKPGVYHGLAMAEYIAAPAVSASLLQTLLDECPRAAWHDSWLNPKARADDSDAAQSAGTIAHGILLEGSTANVAVIDPRDYPTKTTGNIPDGWTNKDIRAARDAAVGAGKTPILAPQMKVVEAMVDVAREFIESLRRAPAEDLARSVWAAFQTGGGESEVTIVWDDDGVLCRIRPDRISTDRTIIVDYKTVTRTAEPEAFGRTALAGMGYYVSGAFYRRGVKAACDVVPEYLFLVQEQEAPFLCSLVGLDPAAQALGDRKIARGVSTWRACARTGNWPAYPARVVYPELPPWEFAGEEEVAAEGHPYHPSQLFGDLKREPLESDPIFS